MSKLLIIGLGSMAAEYVKVAHHLGIEAVAIGRDENKCNAFADTHRISCLRAEPSELITQFDANTPVVNCVSFPSLFAVNKALIEAGFKHILTEKPGAINAIEVGELVHFAQEKSSKLYVAYNRRHFASVLKLKEILREQKPTSCLFEFTEWSHVIETLNKDAVSLSNWFYGNSTHVLDLVCDLIGKPKEISAYISGDLPWHPAGSVFSGAGVSVNDIVFSYSANWQSAGRWGIEVCTVQGKYLLRPMEKLAFIPKGKINAEDIEVHEVDGLKPGLLSQLQAFIGNHAASLLHIGQHYDNCISFYDKVLKR